MKKTALLLATSVLASQGVAYALGVTPYLPLNLDPDVESQVERVLILGDEPVMTRPIPAAMVLDALPKACKVDRPLCESVRRYLDRYMRNTGVEFTSVSAAATTGSSEYRPAEPARGKGAEPLRGRRRCLCAAEFLHAAQRRRRRLPGPRDSDRDHAKPRIRLGTARYRLARPLVVTDDRQLDADQHGVADDALHHAVELSAADAPRVPVRSLHRPDVGIGPHRAHQWRRSPTAIPRWAASV